MTTLEGGITFDPPVSPISRGSREQTYIFTQTTVAGGWNELRALQVIAAKQARLDALTDGWRGPDSLAPTPTARAFYAAAIRGILSLSGGRGLLLDAEPAPMPDGGIQLEWDRDTGGYSAEITAGGQLILNVFTDDPAHDAELTIEQPNPLQLAEFIAFGTYAGTHALGF
jgi:hypothetical protein